MGSKGGILSPLHYPHQNNVEQDLVTPLGVLVWLGRLHSSWSEIPKNCTFGKKPGFFSRKEAVICWESTFSTKFFFWIKQALKASKQSWFFNVTRWFAGLRPASLLGLRLPNKLGVFATDTVGNLKFPGTKGTFRYNTVRKN